MLSTYNKFVIENKIVFNCKRSVCINYGFNEKESEIAKFKW